jgi:hypothetical protein
MCCSSFRFAINFRTLPQSYSLQNGEVCKLGWGQKQEQQPQQLKPKNLEHTTAPWKKTQKLEEIWTFPKVPSLKEL